jgi:hypothetical protein
VKIFAIIKSEDSNYYSYKVIITMATISKAEYHPTRWLTLVLATLGLWMAGSLILDFVIMPTMYISGMMEETGFTSAGTLIFSVFNRIELVCAAVTDNHWIIAISVCHCHGLYLYSYPSNECIRN